MAEQQIASAITVPEPAESAVPNNDLKRPAGEHEEHGQDGKRRRMSSGKTPPTNETAATDPESRERSQPTTTTVTSEASKVENISRGAAEREARRKSTAVEEKQRSKRLFGALLGSLNQSARGGAGADRTTKLRKEIEDRRKAELRRQDERDARDLQQKRDRLVELRRREKDDIDEQNMRIRHRHILDSANYLKTRAEPQVYYRPWDLRPDEEDRIDDQIRDAQAQVDKELRESHKPGGVTGLDGATDNDTRESKDDDVVAENSATSANEHPENDDDTGAPGAEQSAPDQSIDDEGQAQPTNAPDISGVDPPDAATNGDATTHADIAGSGEGPVAEGDEGDEDEDHIVEGDEDTVIY